jgi:hypothetical protein
MNEDVSRRKALSLLGTALGLSLAMTEVAEAETAGATQSTPSGPPFNGRQRKLKQRLPKSSRRNHRLVWRWRCNPAAPERRYTRANRRQIGRLT